MQKKKKKNQTNKENESMKLRKLACTLPNQLYFQYFILLFFSSPAGSLPFHIFFSLLFSHPHASSHTPRFPLFSVLNFLSSLSFYVVFLFVLLFTFVCVFFNLMAVNSSYDFSPLLTQVSHRGFFVLLYFFCKVRLFISFFFFFLGWEFSFTVQTPCRPNLEFRPVFTEGFLIERVRRGFLVWESDPIPKSKWRRIGKKNREESPKRCSLRLETKGPCESSEPVTVHRTNRSDRGLYGSLFFFSWNGSSC